MKTKLNVGSGVRPKGTPDNEWEDLDIREEVPQFNQTTHTPDIVADCRQIPRDDNTYELVYAHSILEHFGKREKKTCLEEWYRVLDVGGRIWISVPDIYLIGVDLVANKNIQYLINLIYGEQSYEENQHKWGYTKESIQKDLEEVGFIRVTFFPPERYAQELIVEGVK